MKTLVIGASENTNRYANNAIVSLQVHGHKVLALAKRDGEVASIKFETMPVHFEKVDTVTLYVNPEIQKSYYSYIISLNPRRVIFNPGTENSEFERQLKQNGIEVVIACTLTLLSTNQY